MAVFNRTRLTGGLTNVAPARDLPPEQSFIGRVSDGSEKLKNEVYGIMKRLISLLLALVLCLALLPSALAAAETVGGYYRQTEARSMLEMINEYRTGGEAWYWNADDTTKNDCGVLQPLTYDYALERIAMQRAAELVLNFDHVRPNGEICFTCAYGDTETYGENIAYNYPSAGSVYNAWLEDDEPYGGQGHRRSILSSGFTAIGIACFEYDGSLYWVQEFGDENSGMAETAADDGWEEVSVETSGSEPVDPAELPPGSVEISAGNFPDESFRDVILTYYDYDRDGWLMPEEIAETYMLLCYSAGISSLEGIEYFTEIKYLDCSDNLLKELDISRNARLEYLLCGYNSLTALDVTGLSELEALECPGNMLTALDLGGNPMLATLSCESNRLTALDLRANPDLAWLYCYDNLLTSLDLSPCPSLCDTVREGRTDPEVESEGVTAYFRYVEEEERDYWGLTVDSDVRLSLGGDTPDEEGAYDAAAILNALVGLGGDTDKTTADAADILRRLRG